MLENFLSILIAFGPIGLFMASIIGNATLFLPLPIDILIIPLASIDYFGLGILSPLILAFIVGLGAAIGEMSGYFVGLAGISSFEKLKNKQFQNLNELKAKLDKWGMWLIAFFAFTPLPFDLIGIVAGISKYSKVKFFIGCFVGKFPRYIILCYAGYFGIQFITSIFAG
ncbi:MAG: VTT domain-containing protein, partial [Candidatus ainarchaeum sp.]|nr:VTT domain-containing protein [Candidatus ainarchaeum sp.]